MAQNDNEYVQMSQRPCIFPRKEFVLEFAEPALLISELVSSSDALSAAYSAAIEAHGATSWRMIVAFDEFAPGAKLRVDNRRKAMNVFISFLELGQHVLSEASAWTIPMVVRHVMLARIPGGWARVLRCFLDRLLFGTHGVATVGLAIKLGQSTHIIKPRLHCILADGEGLKYSFDWKGSSGLKPCLTHVNILKKGSDLAGRREGFVEVSCDDPSKFRAWRQCDARQTMMMLIEADKRVNLGTLTKKRLDDLSMSFGLLPNEHSLWTHPQLSNACTTDLMNTITFDWVHSFLQDGAWAVEAWFSYSTVSRMGLPTQTSARS